MRIQTGNDFLLSASFVFHHTVLFSMNLHRKIRVSGRVQGVGFRDATWRKAMELGILGSVRNLDDGRVEILASAKSELMEQFENWCRNGPPHARVDQIEISESSSVDFLEFRIEY